MLSWLKSLFEEKMSDDDFKAGLAWKEARLDRPFFEKGECPFSHHVKTRGTVVREQRGVRHDN